MAVWRIRCLFSVGYWFYSLCLTAKNWCYCPFNILRLDRRCVRINSFQLKHLRIGDGLHRCFDRGFVQGLGSVIQAHVFRFADFVLELHIKLFHGNAPLCGGLGVVVDNLVVRHFRNLASGRTLGGENEGGARYSRVVETC